MAQVPVSPGNRVARQPLPGSNIRTADFGSAGERVGQAAARLGDRMADFAEYQERMQATHDDAAAKEAENAVRRHYSEAAYTGNDPYFRKTGKAALESRESVETGIDSFIDTTLGNLKTERQKEMFKRSVEPQRIAWGAQIAAYADKQTKAYEVGESTARRDLTGELAREMFLDDPDEAQKQIDTGLIEIDNIGRSMGWGPEQTKTEKLKYSSGIYKDIGKRLTYAGGNDGPALAQALVDKFGNAMTGDDREAVLTFARTQENHLEVERRRVEADQRRQEREARQDAKDRAQSVAANIDLGIPMEAEEYAAALQDARASGDEALVKRIETGQFKNSLSQEFRDTPPPQIQERVNSLDAQIAKAGSNVKPETVIERDHLQTLLNKSNSELNSDSLSWGARHLGIDPGTLNLNNPSSINARIDASLRVSKATGKQPQPLTTEEAQALAPALTTGTMDQKVKLVTGLARMGPLALSAARQVAPDNAAFHGIVGLATHSNAQVGQSRVRQILHGQEILAGNTKPDLIENEAAKRMFEQYAGEALRFLPTVRNGAYENAKALLASESEERGYSAWGDASSRWFAAVNAAVGGGLGRGGLHRFNGAMTVVPEDMAPSEFEQKVGRAQGPQIKKAQNGTPLYSDGRPATASEVKKMRWVPAADGVYRITPDGRNFLKTREGGFYQVDVRKL